MGDRLPPHPDLLTLTLPSLTLTSSPHLSLPNCITPSPSPSPSPSPPLLTSPLPPPPHYHPPLLTSHHPLINPSPPPHLPLPLPHPPPRNASGLVSHPSATLVQRRTANSSEFNMDGARARQAAFSGALRHGNTGLGGMGGGGGGGGAGAGGGGATALVMPEAYADNEDQLRVLSAAIPQLRAMGRGITGEGGGGDGGAWCCGGGYLGMDGRGGGCVAVNCCIIE